MFESTTSEKLVPRIEDKIITSIEKFDDLTRSTKYFVAGIGSLCTAAVTETASDSVAVPFACLLVAVGYFGVAYRTYGEDNPIINSESSEQDEA